MTEGVGQVYEFTFVLSGVTSLTTGLVDSFIIAGCLDAILVEMGDRVGVTFRRTATSLSKAIDSASDDVRRAGYGVASVIGFNPWVGER